MSASPRRLLVLHDSPQFGGHERMFFRFLPYVLESAAFDEIVFRFPAGNANLAGALAGFASDKIRLLPWRFAKRPAEPYLGRFRLDYGRALRATVERLKPATILLLQGRIENCVVPMRTLPRRQFLVSYLPMAQSLREMGRSGLIGDAVRRPLYARPDRFIVPSAGVAEQVARAGGRGSRIVVDNVVDPPPRPDRNAARAACGLPSNGRVALFLGRLDVGQKGLDLLSDAILRSAGSLDGWIFQFVGGGPGAPLIEWLRERLAGQVDIRVQPWTERPHEYLAAADALLMPSRWEGVPLVMLEAMTYGVPVLASPIDVFREFLPSGAIVDFATVDLAAALDGLAGDHDRHAELAAMRLRGSSLDRSGTRFAEVLHA